MLSEWWFNWEKGTGDPGDGKGRQGWHGPYDSEERARRSAWWYQRRHGGVAFIYEKPYGWQPGGDKPWREDARAEETTIFWNPVIWTEAELQKLMEILKPLAGGFDPLRKFELGPLVSVAVYGKLQELHDAWLTRMVQANEGAVSILIDQWKILRQCIPLQVRLFIEQVAWDTGHTAWRGIVTGFGVMGKKEYRGNSGEEPPTKFPPNGPGGSRSRSDDHRRGRYKEPEPI